MTDECMQTQMQTICIQVRKIFVIQFLALPFLLAVFYKNIDINNIRFSPSHILYHMFLAGCDRLLLHMYKPLPLPNFLHICTC